MNRPEHGRLGVGTAAALGMVTAIVLVTTLALVFSKDANKDAQRVFVDVGNCYRDRGGQGVLVTEAYQPCTGPHDREIVGLVSLTDSDTEPYPGRARLVRIADAECPGMFKTYVGAPYPAVGLVLRILVPSPGEWDVGFHDAVCAVGDGGGQSLTGSVKNRAASS